MSRKQTSAVWKYFTYDSSTGRATCNTCKKSLKHRNASTYNLNRHIRHKHPDDSTMKRRILMFDENNEQEQTYIMEIQEGEEVMHESPIILVHDALQSSEEQPNNSQDMIETVDHKPAPKSKKKKFISADNYILPMQQKYQSIKSQTTWSGPDAIHEVLHQRGEELKALKEMTQAMKEQTETLVLVQQTMQEMKNCLIVQGEILEKILHSHSSVQVEMAEKMLHSQSPEQEEIVEKILHSESRTEPETSCE